MLYQAKFSFSMTITILFVISQAKSVNSENNKCHGSCATSNFSGSLPFPFGFTPGCPIQLNCSRTGVRIGIFHVLNVTSTDIIIDLPAKCDRRLDSISVLFHKNYAVSVANNLLLQNCSTPLRYPCEIRPMFLEKSYELNSCADKSDNITCFAGGDDGGQLLNFEDVNDTQCHFLFSSTSVVVDPARNSTVFMEFERVNLEWWVNGQCNCDKNANCTLVELGNRAVGFRCLCHEGFEGDGFKEGRGCRRVISRPSRLKSWIWILISLLMALIVTILLGILFYLRRRQKIRREEKFLLELLTSDKTSETREFLTGSNGHNLNIYTAALIMFATNDFSPDNLLGKGGFGPVFKGTLPDGKEVAIKRLSKGSGQGLVEFKNELILIAKLQHINLVRLLGFCVQREEKMLVYEYMPNKSLDSFIFDESKRKLLDWDKRFSIIEGIAQGLLYLHKYSRLKIIHRDLKASNILLDENLNPKISDFGMARIYKTNEAESNTNRIVGTYGYMSPEYAMDGIFSVKSDVYSFGVLLLEVVSGRKNTSRIHSYSPVNLVGYAWELWKHGGALELVDPTLSDSCSKQQVLKCITLGLRCVEDRPVDRPTMSDVISILTGEMQLPLPKHPAFSMGRSIIETNAGEKEMENFSLNRLSTSVMDPR